MSWLKTTILIAGLLWAKLAYCEIHEIKNMAAIVPAIQDDTLLVFDIDNTLIEPVGNLGSDQWFYYLYKIYKINGFDEKTTQQQALRAWNQAQSLISVRAAEASIPDLIQSQQKKGLKMLALTARSVEIAEKTSQQLASVNISFAGHSVLGEDLEIDKGTLQSEHGAFFRNGVMYVGEGNDKGQVLAYFLQKLHLNPKRVVYVDDKSHHVQAVDRALSALNIPCFCFRYGALDEKVKAYEQLMSEVTDRDSARLFLLGELSAGRTRKRGSVNRAAAPHALHKM